MTPRLTAEFWVSAYLRRLQLADIPAFIVSKGDETAGAILIKQNTLDRKASLYQRSFDIDGKRCWVILSEGEEHSVDAAIQKQRQFDPDLWVIEVEDRHGRHLLEEEGLKE